MSSFIYAGINIGIGICIHTYTYEKFLVYRKFLLEIILGKMKTV